ncbi:MAG: protein kinase domain-containing protein [Bradymonadia bacterium]
MRCTICEHEDPAAAFGAQCPDDQSYLVDEDSYREGRGDPLLGRLIGEEFAIVGIIGSGGFGSVYRSIQQPIGRVVALKILHGHAGRRPEVRRRFIREAKALARLSDPNIVQFIRFAEVKSETGRGLNDFFFIAQEYVDGEHLGRVIRSSAPMGWQRVRFLTRSILKALAAAHKQNITHRDLKPTNIMVCEDAFQGDLVKVLDFGIAKFLADHEDEDEPTMTGTLLGTPNYMSPEQIRNQPVGPASDLYAVGILMYEMLTGKRPFARESKIDTLRAHLEGAVPDLSGLPLAAQKIIAVALCKLPEDRYSSAREMAEALDQMDSLGSFTSDGLEAPSILEEAAVPFGGLEQTSVDSVSVVATRVRESMGGETPIVLTQPKEIQDGRPLMAWIALALLGIVLGGAVWLVNSNGASDQRLESQQQQESLPPLTKPVDNSVVPAQMKTNSAGREADAGDRAIREVVQPPVKKLTPTSKSTSKNKRKPPKKSIVRRPSAERKPERKPTAKAPEKKTQRAKRRPKRTKPVRPRPVEIQEL